MPFLVLSSVVQLGVRATAESCTALSTVSLDCAVCRPVQLYGITISRKNSYIVSTVLLYERNARPTCDDALASPSVSRSCLRFGVPALPGGPRGHGQGAPGA